MDIGGLLGDIMGNIEAQARMVVDLGKLVAALATGNNVARDNAIKDAMKNILEHLKHDSSILKNPAFLELLDKLPATNPWAMAVKKVIELGAKPSAEAIDKLIEWAEKHTDPKALGINNISRKPEVEKPHDANILQQKKGPLDSGITESFDHSSRGKKLEEGTRKPAGIAQAAAPSLKK